MDAGLNPAVGRRPRGEAPETHGPVEGEALPCGHLIPEERPDLVISQFCRFFAA